MNVNFTTQGVVEMANGVGKLCRGGCGERDDPTQGLYRLTAVVALHRLGVRDGMKQGGCSVERVTLGMVGIGYEAKALTILVSAYLLQLREALVPQCLLWWLSLLESFPCEVRHGKCSETEQDGYKKKSLKIVHNTLRSINYAR